MEPRCVCRRGVVCCGFDICVHARLVPAGVTTYASCVGLVQAAKKKGKSKSKKKSSSVDPLKVSPGIVILVDCVFGVPGRAEITTRFWKITSLLQQVVLLVIATDIIPCCD